jgi:hypothetical protein
VKLVTGITVMPPALPYFARKKLRVAWSGVEAKMQKMSSVLAYVVSEGRVCALKPSDWSILLAGVVICGFATMVFLASQV